MSSTSTNSPPEPHGPRACPSSIELAAWCDGTLEPMRAGAVAMHLIDCADCRALIPAVDADHAGFVVDVDSDLVGRVVDRASELVAPAALKFVPSLSSSTGRARMTGRVWWNTVAAAASIAAAIIGWQASMLLTSIDVGAERTTRSVRSGTGTASTEGGLASIVDPSGVSASLGPAGEWSRASDTMQSNEESAMASREDSEMTLLLTFGLFDDLGDTDLFQSGDERSES